MTDKQMTTGEKIGEILEEIEMYIWEQQVNEPGEPFYFDEKSFRAATKIFASVLMEFNYRYRKSNNQKFADMAKNAQELGQQIRYMIRNNTGIDSTTWYKEGKV